MSDAPDGIPGAATLSAGVPFEHKRPDLRVEALIMDLGTNREPSRVLFLHQVSTGFKFLPGGSVRAEETPLAALKRHLLARISMDGFMISSRKLVALDSEIRPHVKPTKLILVFHVIPTWGLNMYPAVEADFETVTLTPRQWTEELARAPYTLRRVQACYKAVRANNPPLMLLCGNPTQ